ncbi:MAG: twin-arginine translocation signal domain-containing protein [Acidobacteria bacterium]|nr:twin-arginine translocation signal domain-containing protein [Acidobacteriota bacterium]
MNRRGFLKGAAAGAAAFAAAPPAVAGQSPVPVAAAIPRPAGALAAETETAPAPLDVLTEGRPGSDFMVDVIKSLGVDYICANPGSSFRGLHESVINYGGNAKPEWITCLHEEISAAIADGYAQVEGKPLIVAAHGTVGLQHAAMAIYNSFCGRVPVYIIAGNSLDASTRRPGIEWLHSVQDAAAMVREFIKWDDNPVSLQHFAESAVRAYKIMMTPPTAPVLLAADSDLAERKIENESALRIPKLTLPAPPQGETAAVAEAAKLLVAAENPVLFAGRARTQAGMDLLVQLAETLQAPIQGGMPSRHPLSQRGALDRADVVLGLEVDDLWGALHGVRDQLHRTFRPLTKPGAKVISIGTRDLYTKSNYQDFQRYPEVDIAIAADVEATLPSLIDACKRLITAGRGRVLEERGRQLAENKARQFQRARVDATYGWDASPITTARLQAEVWEAIKNKDWASGGGGGPLWNIDKHYRTIDGAGGGGLGHGPPAGVGAALAHRKHGRLFVKFQNDGDMMYTPGALWTAAHHRIPMLFVMRNNRAYHQEVMHIQRMANRYQRGATADKTHIGVAIDDPNIDFAMLARSMGLYGEGPITEPQNLGPALRRAVERVEKGEVALVDVVTQPR